MALKHIFMQPLFWSSISMASLSLGALAHSMAEEKTGAPYEQTRSESLDLGSRFEDCNDGCGANAPPVEITLRDRTYIGCDYCGAQRHPKAG